MNTSFPMTYPIANETNHSLLKRVVKTMLANENFYNYYHSISPRNSKADISNAQEEWCVPQLIFPADIPEFRHQPEVAGYSFFVAGFSAYRCGFGESGLADEDGPELRMILVAEGESALSEDGIDYCEYEIHSTLPLPRFDYDAEALKHAFHEIISLTERLHEDNTRQWTTRLHAALEMFSSGGNPIKIITEAGLYDFEALRSMIVQKHNTDHAAIQTIRNYEHHLHRYAMSIINRTPVPASTDTKAEGIPSVGITQTETWISNIQTHRPEEYKWMKYIHSASLPEHVTEPTYVRDLLPEKWPDDVEAMRHYLQWTDADEANLRSSLCDTATHDAYIASLRELVRKQLREEAIKEFNNKKAEWMVLYNR